MTKDDMIRMAREAGWEYADDDRGFEPLWAFANLVAAAERKACAKLCERDDSMRWSGAAAAIRAMSQS